ncbi:MAG: hypothetical protein AVDCRST_MAG68-334, partial [uncultured Gemmatimonadetes bacterium]
WRGWRGGRRTTMEQQSHTAARRHRENGQPRTLSSRMSLPTPSPSARGGSRGQPGFPSASPRTHVSRLSCSPMRARREASMRRWRHTPGPSGLPFARSRRGSVVQAGRMPARDSRSRSETPAWKRSWQTWPPSPSPTRQRASAPAG